MRYSPNDPDEPFPKGGEKSVYYQDRRKRRLCRDCSRPNDAFPKARCSECQPKHNAYMAGRHGRLKEEVFAAYGGKCACCGLADTRYFQMDHINNNGAEHRRTLRPNSTAKRASLVIYPWLKVNGFPEGFQILCANCHQAKTVYGGCGCQGEHPWSIIKTTEYVWE